MNHHWNLTTAIPACESPDGNERTGIYDPPNEIAETPFVLDGVVFARDGIHRIERAVRCGVKIGHVLHDDNRFWFARKVDPATGDVCDWKPMRCVHEARAYLVSRMKQ